MGALATFRNWIGLAVVGTDGTATAALESGATSLSVASISGISDSDSIIFLDGPNTEVVAVSSAPTGGSVPIAATTYAHPLGCYYFVQPTASLGPTTFVPVTDMKVPDTYEQLYDKSYVGSRVDVRSVSQGMRTSEWQIDGNVYCDTIGYFLGGFFGAEDFTSGSPNEHVFAANNQGNGQPPKIAFYIYDDVNLRVVVGRISDLSFKYDPKALISYSSKILSRASGVVPNATPSYSALTPQATWRAAVTLAGSYIRNPLTVDVTLTAGESENIPTITGTQDPFDSFVGSISATQKTSFVKQDDSLIDLYTAGTTYTYVLAFTQGSGAEQVGIAIQSSVCNSDTDEPGLTGKSYNTEDIGATFVGNSTDANTSGGGLSPCRITLYNAIGEGVYIPS